MSNRLPLTIAALTILALTAGCGPLEQAPRSSERALALAVDPGLEVRSNAVMDTILGPVLTEVQAPSLERTWIQEQSSRFPNKLSYYRHKLDEAFVLLEGKLLARSGDQLLREIVLDRFRYGPDRFELRIRSGLWYSSGKVAPGKAITIYLGDDEGKRHYGFHGRIASTLQAVEDGSALIVIRGYAPKLTDNERRTRRFYDYKHDELVQQVMSEHSLYVDTEGPSADRLDVVDQAAVSDLGFTYQLARENGYDAYLCASCSSSARFIYKESSFAVPASEAKTRALYNMKYSEAACLIAQSLSLTCDAEDSGDRHNVIFQSDETDLDLLHRLASEIDFEVYVTNKRLIFKHDAAAPKSYKLSQTFPKTMRRSDVAAAIATKYGLSSSISVSGLGPTIVQRDETDVELLHRLAHEIGFVAHFEHSKLVFERPPAGSFRETDYLERRIRINCRHDRRYSAKLRVINNHPLAGLKYPTRVAVTEIQFDLHHDPANPTVATWAIPAPGQASLREADQLLRDALQTLDQVTDSPLIFKRHVARVFATSVLHRIATSSVDWDAVRAELSAIEADLQPVLPSLPSK